MAQTIEEFRSALLLHNERVQRVREHVRNEEATKVSLILPFIALLGYDILDPTEVAAEHACDFSDKYKNRADYAILKEMKPIIAVECKTSGATRKDDRGQLKSYFNASKTVKLGILTDGIRFECFVDSIEQNMMDDDPFLEIEFGDSSKFQLSDTVLENLFSLTKGRFDPEMVGESARKSITYRALYDYLNQQFQNPSAEFVRLLLKEVNIKYVHSRAIDGYRVIAKSAFKDVFNNNLLKRLEITETPRPVPDTPAAAAVTAEDAAGIVTTEAELAAYQATRMRLAFLSAGDPQLFGAIDKVNYRDYHGKMAVFYAQVLKGRLLDILEAKDGSIRYVLADGQDGTPVADIAALDARLKALFAKRVAEV